MLSATGVSRTLNAHITQLLHPPTGISYGDIYYYAPGAFDPSAPPPANYIHAVLNFTSDAPHVVPEAEALVRININLGGTDNLQGTHDLSVFVEDGEDIIVDNDE